MIQYKRFLAMATAATVITISAAGSTSEAADFTFDTSHLTTAGTNAEFISELLSAAADEESENIAETVEEAKLAYEEQQKEAEEKAAQAAAEQAAAEAAAAQAAAQAAAEAAAAEAAAQAAAEAAAVQAAYEASGELQLMAALIYCEAGNQPYEGQVAVGAVIMNRVRSSVYPNSITEVIYQSGQFGPAMTGWLDSVLASGSYSATAMQAASDAIAGSNPIGDCLYFGCGSYGIQIGDHYFH